MEAPLDRSRAVLEASRADFHSLLDAMTSEMWNRQSRNPAWTNGQLLFHIALAFILIRPLLPIMRVSARLPASWGRAFAAGLDALAPLFHRVNALGPRLGARVFGRQRLGHAYDRTHAAILRALGRLDEQDWRVEMPYPRRWDHRFSSQMTPEALIRYTATHLQHHRGQLQAV